MAVNVGDTPVLLIRAGGRVRALHDRCSHRGCSLAGGRLEGDTIECPCHGSIFSLEDGAIARQERQSLEEAMATLSVEDREVLALYYVQKRTTKEIAQIQGCAPGTIMARLFRAREKLRKKMTTEEPT